MMKARLFELYVQCTRDFEGVNNQAISHAVSWLCDLLSIGGVFLLGWLWSVSMLEVCFILYSLLGHIYFLMYICMYAFQML